MKSFSCYVHHILIIVRSPGNSVASKSIFNTSSDGLAMNGFLEEREAPPKATLEFHGGMPEGLTFLVIQHQESLPTDLFTLARLHASSLLQLERKFYQDGIFSCPSHCSNPQGPRLVAGREWNMFNKYLSNEGTYHFRLGSFLGLITLIFPQMTFRIIVKLLTPKKKFHWMCKIKLQCHTSNSYTG